MRRFVLALSLVTLCPLAGLHAQVFAPNEAGVAMGHWHTTVKDVEASKKFWVLLGGTPAKVGGTEAIKFPGVLIYLTKGEPSGGTIGTVVDHLGLKVTNGKEYMTKLQAAGVKMDEHAGFQRPGGTGWGYVFSPDDLRVEILDNVEALKKNDLAVPPAADHVHYLVPESAGPEIQAWYAQRFGGKPIQENNTNRTLAAEFPGSVKLRIGKTSGSLLPTKGRTLDHIAFEVKNLEALCRKLEASGVKFDQPYRKSSNPAEANARFTDPWGVSVELTGGHGE